MSEKIIVPDIGDYQDVEIIEVLIKAGDVIAVEQSLITLESDKATMDVPSPIAGVVTNVLVNPGDKVSQGTVIALATTEITDTINTTTPETNASPIDTTTTISDNTTTEHKIYVPNIGDFKNVEIIDVLIAVGDLVSTDQSLLTLESDKATMDVPSPVSGIIKTLLVQTGDKISEGDAIATINLSSATATAPPSPNTHQTIDTVTVDDSQKTVEITTNKKNLAPTTSPQTNSADKPYAGPAVRYLARQLGVDLSEVQGSGKNKRIQKEDVKKHVKQIVSAAKEKTNTSSTIPTIPDIDFAQFGDIEEQTLSRINKLSATNLHRNWLAAPHVTQMDKADITDLEAFRLSLVEDAKKNGYRMTPLAFFVKAAVTALKAFPRFNASLKADQSTLVLKKYYHIGVAVDTPNGLVVPVLRNADSKGLKEIAKELTEISQTAREGTLKRDAMTGGCFTISSLGGIGGASFTPIINLPEVAILGISRSAKEPHWDGEKFVPRLKLPLALSYDHRVIDGAAGARFITFYAELLGDIRRLAL